MKISDYKDRIIDKLSNNENYGYSPTQAEGFYNTHFSSLPDDIVPNVKEWLNNKPFSDIDYYGLSIKKMQDYDILANKCSNRYLYYFLTMSLFKKNGCINPESCIDNILFMYI